MISGRRPGNTQDMCAGARFVLDADRVGGDRQMRAMLLEHPDSQKKQRFFAIEGVDLTPVQLGDREHTVAGLLNRAAGFGPDARRPANERQAT